MRVGRYLLEEVIGIGSFATVHRARDERLDDGVVVKILAENHSLNPEIRERFIAEGRALRRVSSPHVVAVHDIGENDRQQPYLVLEHADRGTLADRVERLRGQGWTAAREDVLVLARQLAAALEAVHAAHLVHRDLSPTNVLLTSAPDRGVERAGGAATSGAQLVTAEERVVVADLGMCKDLALNSGLTVAGGTAGYRPPELEGGPAVIDTRADLWSLSSLVSWVCEGADLPDGLDQALGHSLAADPGDRHATVADWLRDVEEALQPPAPDPEPDRGPALKVPVVGPRRPMAPLLTALALTLALGLLGGWLLRGSGPSEATTTARIEIQGPDHATVGEPVELTLRHVGMTSWVWVLPDGAHLSDRESVTLTPTGAGSAVVTVTGRDAEGADLRTQHRFTVAEEP